MHSSVWGVFNVSFDLDLVHMLQLRFVISCVIQACLLYKHLPVIKL